MYMVVRIVEYIIQLNLFHLHVYIYIYIHAYMFIIAY